MAERFAVPDQYSTELKASDLANYDRLRVITDAHDFIVPLILLAAAITFWAGMRYLLPPQGTVKRMIALWWEAKERELKTRAGRTP